MQFSRNQLRRFHADELSKVPELSDFDEEISVLDGMPVLEGFIQNSIENKHENYLTIDKAVNTFQEKNIYAKDETSTLFMLHLKSALLKALQDKENPLSISDITSENIEKAIEANLDFFCVAPNRNKKILNKEIISQVYSLKGPHGSQIMSDYHAKILVNNIIIPTLKSITHAKSIPNVVDDFYHSGMDKLDTCSSLFILHLKCALIENAIKDITKNEIKTAITSQGMLFYKNNNRYKLNKEKIAQTFKINDQHGGFTEPDDPAREVVRRMIIPCLKQKYASRKALNSYGLGSYEDLSTFFKRC